ncbi:hypothetical protein CVT24_001632 [Panaeolus cyanescens]|uniref:G domain-containing protein n=1 Tax=Panaeolus cyanescens TaxID=181874 RepID=A0A409W3E1_9AGAR|nr:hypothetical protein CVT24_001632 [Panaeolus cyanescens]
MSKTPTYFDLQINGHVSVRRWEWGGYPGIYDAHRILIAGPTGAGKSSFIEALAGDKKLGISKNQLEGYTQSVTPYELVNASFEGAPICLLDSPGFSDSNISEMEVLNMLKQFLMDYNIKFVHSLLYFCPITDVRLPGSRRKTIEMLRCLVRTQSISTSGGSRSNDGTLTVVTTMWDNVWNERVRERAEGNLAQLRDEIFKDMIEHGAAITQFMNTRDSALEILDTGRSHWVRAPAHAYQEIVDEGPLGQRPHGYFLYQDLVERIANLRQRKTALEYDLAQKETIENEDLKSSLEAAIDDTRRLLTKFEEQLVEFGEPPCALEIKPNISHQVSKDSRSGTSIPNLSRLWVRNRLHHAHVFIKNTFSSNK